MRSFLLFLHLLLIGNTNLKAELLPSPIFSGYIELSDLKKSIKKTLLDGKSKLQNTHEIDDPINREFVQKVKLKDMGLLYDDEDAYLAYFSQDSSLVSIKLYIKVQYVFLSKSEIKTCLKKEIPIRTGGLSDITSEGTKKTITYFLEEVTHAETGKDHLPYAYLPVSCSLKIPNCNLFLDGNYLTLSGIEVLTNF